jgi:hypothetical protein
MTGDSQVPGDKIRWRGMPGLLVLVEASQLLPQPEREVSDCVVGGEEGEELQELPIQVLLVTLAGLPRATDLQQNQQ